MTLTTVDLQNVGIIRKLTITCNGGVVVVSGANGTGKSTVLTAIRTIFSGGSAPELIGPYANEYLIELVFSNGWRFRRTENKKGYTLKGWSADGGKIDSPAKTLQELFDSDYSLSPTGLIDAKPADRVAFLHKAMPLLFSDAEVANAVGPDVHRGGGPFNVDQLDRLRDGYYEERRLANVEHRKLKESRDKMAEALPDNDPLTRTWVETAEGIDGQGKPVPAPVNPLDEVAALQKKLGQAQDSLHQALNGWKGDLDKGLATLAQEENAALDKVRAEFNALRERARAMHAEHVATQRPAFDEYIRGVSGQLAAAQERAQQIAKLEGLRDAIRGVDRQMQAAQDRAVGLDNAVKNLDELKRKKLEKLPIPGVEVRNGQIFVDGLEFETQVNTARKYLLSAQLAALTMKDLPFLIMDNIEAMDEENRRYLIEGLAEGGFQCIVAAVEDDKPLTVEVR